MADAVAAAQADYGDTVAFIGVPAHDTDENMHEFVERHGLQDMLHVVDDDGDIWSRFGVGYQPAWVFVSPDGDTEVAAGAVVGEPLTERLDALATEGERR